MSQDPKPRGRDEHVDPMMASRGVTRPMAEHALRSRAESTSSRGHHAETDGGADPAAGQHREDDPHDQRADSLRAHHQQTLWIYWTILLLGVWMLVSPSTLGHLNEQHWVDPSGGRGAWFSNDTHTALRARLMFGSDLAAGIALLILGWRSLKPNRPFSRWAACGVGVWLTSRECQSGAFLPSGRLLYTGPSKRYDPQATSNRDTGVTLPPTWHSPRHCNLAAACTDGL